MKIMVVLVLAMFAVGFLTVLMMALTDEDDDFMQAQEDEEQAEFLEEWREKHGRK